MYLLLDGRLRAFQLTAEGRKLILEIVQPGGFDGLLPMLGQRGHFTEAADDSVVACLEWDLLEQLLASEPRIIRTLTELLAQRLESREEQLESMVIRNPTRRLARQLSALARAVGDTDAHNGSVALPRTITHQLLADMLGVRRETVTLHLHDLIEMGAVETRRRQLSVRPRQLDAIASREE
jgi:CRP/FNR family transcriptional regulator